MIGCRSTSVHLWNSNTVPWLLVYVGGGSISCYGSLTANNLSDHNSGSDLYQAVVSAIRSTHVPSEGSGDGPTSSSAGGGHRSRKWTLNKSTVSKISILMTSFPLKWSCQSLSWSFDAKTEPHDVVILLAQSLLRATFISTFKVPLWQYGCIKTFPVVFHYDYEVFNQNPTT